MTRTPSRRTVTRTPSKRLADTRSKKRTPSKRLADTPSKTKTHQNQKRRQNAQPIPHQRLRASVIRPQERRGLKPMLKPPKVVGKQHPEKRLNCNLFTKSRKQHFKSEWKRYARRARRGFPKGKAQSRRLL